MDRESFVSKLRLLAPSVEDFKNYSVPESFIKEDIGRYYCGHKPDAPLKIVTSDEILNMLQGYDCSTLGIGNLTFLKEVVEYDDYYQIGEVEIDVLVLNKITLEIEVRDHDHLHHVIWPCASKSTYFLDALFVCAEFLRLLISEPSLADDGAYLLGVVNQCAEKAGGERHIDFYKMLLGYFD